MKLCGVGFEECRVGTPRFPNQSASQFTAKIPTPAALSRVGRVLSLLLCVLILNPRQSSSFQRLTGSVSRVSSFSRSIATNRGLHLLHSAIMSSGNPPIPTEAEVTRLHNRLIAAISDDASQIPAILSTISSIGMNLHLLRSVGIGRTVGKLRKDSNSSVATAAAAIVDRWKAIADDGKAASPATATATASSSSSSSSSSSGASGGRGGNTGLPDLKQYLLSSGPTEALELLECSSSAKIREERVRSVYTPNKASRGAPGNVIYWMSRDQRINDNWALLKAQKIALQNNRGLGIVFCLQSSFLRAKKRHFGFMLRGLKQLESSALGLNIPFHILCGKPEDVLLDFCHQHEVTSIVADFSPLRISRKWKQDVADALQRTASPGIELIEVDAHNIAPCWHVSNKCEFSAKTIRGKIHNAMDTFLTEFPPLVRHPHSFSATTTAPSAASIWEEVASNVDSMDASVDEVEGYPSGEASAIDAMRQFLPRLKTYADSRNDPCVRKGVSGLSPYFHFGQLSVQRVLLEIKKMYKVGLGAMFPSGERTTGIHSFCEEAVVRRELSDNFCYYNEHYDSFEGAHNWAQKTLQEHWNDPRERLYSLEQLEASLTYDPLWNAAQTEMVVCGKMHGFMRMYWAKKILEWSPDPSEALRRAIYLNDKYSLDGRDPNGYVGCMWAIMGVHDRAWGRRPVFGTIRFMNFDGCKRKFDIQRYINAVNALDATSARTIASKAASRPGAAGSVTKAASKALKAKAPESDSEEDEKPAKKLKTK